MEDRFGFVEQFAKCFDDYRSPRFTVPSLAELLRQRIMEIALANEDLNDQEELATRATSHWQSGTFEQRE